MIAIKIAVSALFCIPAYAETAFTGEDFLGWDQSAQTGFVQTSVSMAGIIASQTKPEIARCIDGWYFASDAVLDQRNSEIIALIGENAGFHPSAVILAAIQRECGTFGE